MGQRVNNKDIESIREIPYIQQQILSLERQCQWERSRARNTTQVFSAVPGGGDSARALEKAAAGWAAAQRGAGGAAHEPVCL